MTRTTSIRPATGNSALPSVLILRDETGNARESGGWFGIGFHIPAFLSHVPALHPKDSASEGRD